MHTPLLPPTPSNIPYFHRKDLKTHTSREELHNILDEFLFFAVNPYLKPNEKQHNWNTFVKSLSDTTKDLIAFRRLTQELRSKPNITFIDPEQKDVSDLDYGISTEKAYILNQSKE